MKKNLMTVIILALVFANFVLTALLLFTVYPQTQKANEMITRVCEAIDLELNSGAATGLSNLPIDQIETYDVASGETITVNLKNGGYAVVSVAISVNNKSEIYEKTPLCNSFIYNGNYILWYYICNFNRLATVYFSRDKT